MKIISVTVDRGNVPASCNTCILPYQYNCYCPAIQEIVKENIIANTRSEKCVIVEERRSALNCALAGVCGMLEDDNCFPSSCEYWAKS